MSPLSKKSEVSVYQTARDLLARITADEWRNQEWHDGHVSYMKSDPVWSGGASIEEGVTLSQSGVSRPFAKVASASVSGTLAQVPKRSTRFDVAGGAPSVPRMLSGRPDVMRRMVVQKRSLPIVRIAISGAVNSSIVPEAIEARGMAFLGAVDAIARSGYPTEVWVYLGTYAGEDMFGASVRVKLPGQPMDWQRLAYWLCHASALRIIGFAWEDAVLSPDARARIGFSRGPGTVSAERIASAMPEGLAFAAVFGSPHTNEECRAMRADKIAADAIAAANKLQAKG